MKEKKRKSKFLSKIIFSLFIIIILYCFLETNYLDWVKNKFYELYNNREEIISNIEAEVKPSVNTDAVFSESIKDKIITDDSKLNILFLDVGQADCEVVLCDNKVLMIDAGNTYDGKNIVNGLKELGIEKIDYLIGTHAHEHHVGGISYIIDSFEIDNFYMPKYNNIDFKFYDKVINSAKNKSLEIKSANIGDKFELGKASFEIMNVDNNMPENINDSSIVVELTYGDLKYLFMADSEETSEKSRSWDDVDLLKVGHHGSSSSTSEEFLNQTLPEISVITVRRK